MIRCSDDPRWLLLTALVLMVAALPEGLAQNNYPDRPIRIIVPSAPGGPSDFGARLIGEEMSKRLGRQVVVDNRSGAATMIGSEIVAKAPPDGYTLLMSPSTLAINPAFYKNMAYNALRDFAPITQTVFVPNVIVVHPSLPVKSVKEMIAFAKARPGEIRYASAGYGTNPHLAIELFMSMAQIRMMHVPYKGDMPGMTALLGGEVAIMANTSLSLIIPHLETGRLRALGVTTARRIQALPNVPTIAEAGLPGYEAVQWSGLLAPAKTPREIIARLSKEAVTILRTPEARERLTGVGCEVVASSPEEFSAFMQAETVKWAAVVKAAGIQPE
jgi:tripartite-type tricarboxylate transporter receptor subunit TctC